ncbi:hypothetical protein H0H81_011535, partial [Sphagnurus paluster]
TRAYLNHPLCKTPAPHFKTCYNFRPRPILPPPYHVLPSYDFLPCLNLPLHDDPSVCSLALLSPVFPPRLRLPPLFDHPPRSKIPLRFDLPPHSEILPRFNLPPRSNIPPHSNIPPR